MDTKVKMGFPPVFDNCSRVLILGSFPSVKSREISFYYGNKQNRFWKTLFSIFNQPFLESTEERIAFLKEKGSARWDVVE
ncbi:MAG: DNA-deoxyinosine glycosylase, partial [Clostridia bacterium]|nr:DNA-deoxyinosine glycosylase [Clostridia bacterium]